jgi:hypothetical protein
VPTQKVGLDVVSHAGHAIVQAQVLDHGHGIGGAQVKGGLEFGTDGAVLYLSVLGVVHARVLWVLQTLLIEEAVSLIVVPM